MVNNKMKIDNVVKKETKYIIIWVGLLSLLMQSVFLVTGFWDISVLLGNILGAFVAVLNFFLMGLAIQRAVQKSEDDAKKSMNVSSLYRKLMIFVIVIIGIVVPYFNNWTVIIPLFFPRVAIAFRPLVDKGNK
ncbi:MAG: ATP synthase subunit I [Clostridia bacterium]|nr:ATP synthase subunit I [Clostridia bacterium]